MSKIEMEFVGFNNFQNCIAIDGKIIKTQKLNKKNAIQKMKKTPKYLISGGGTGGHIFPAVSIANALRELQPDCEILFVGALGRMENGARAGRRIQNRRTAGERFRQKKYPEKHSHSHQSAEIDVASTENHQELPTRCGSWSGRLCQRRRAESCIKNECTHSVARAKRVCRRNQ